jgi:hypothetical protein
MYNIATFEGNVSDWHGNLLDRDDAICKLMPGSIVRLLFRHSDGHSDMPYAIITQVIRYHWKPKLFIGRILDTYRNLGVENYYPPTNSMIRFNKYHIAEITDWDDESIVRPVAIQPSQKIRTEPSTIYRRSKCGNLISISYKYIGNDAYIIERSD